MEISLFRIQFLIISSTSYNKHYYQNCQEKGRTFGNTIKKERERRGGKYLKPLKPETESKKLSQN